MKAVVVGGLGMIGSAVARELLSRGDYVLVLDLERTPDLHQINGQNPRLEYRRCDIRDLAALIGAVSGADEVYHFAGELGTSDMDDDIRGAIETNVKGTLNVLDACLVQRVPRLFNPTKPQVWLNTYTITKTCTEQFCKLYDKLHGDRLQVSQLRYFNAFGRDQHLFPIRKIVPAFAVAAMEGLPIEVFGDGEQTVDMIHVDDMAYLTVEAVRAGLRGEPIDCGSGEELTVNHVADMVAAFYHPGRPRGHGVRHLPMRRGEDPHTRLVADTGPLKKLLGDRYRCRSFNEGLSQTLDWMRSIPAEEIDRACRFYNWR